MVTPQRAYYIAKSIYPEAEFSGNCFDYHGNYAFPYFLPNAGDFFNTGTIAFVSKESGKPVIDLGLNVVEMEKAPNVKDEIKW